MGTPARSSPIPAHARPRSRPPKRYGGVVPGKLQKRSMSISPRKLGPLPRGEALTLLASVPLGRIVFTVNAMPAVRPASHLVTGGVVIARSHDGSRSVPFGAARPGEGGRETVVAYQADDIDLGTRLGWSVVITGPATQVEDPAEIEEYEAVLPPWTEAGDAGGERGQIICIQPGIVNGYRLTANLSGADRTRSAGRRPPAVLHSPCWPSRTPAVQPCTPPIAGSEA